MSQDNWQKAAQENSALCTYQLSIHLSRSVSIQVGRLGRFTFPAGDYVYTGSAKRNLIARVRRHLSNEKKLRWHIDYLLASRYAKVKHVSLSSRPECQCNQAVLGEVVVKGFGASDCQALCGSHLKLSQKKQPS